MSAHAPGFAVVVARLTCPIGVTETLLWQDSTAAPTLDERHWSAWMSQTSGRPVRGDQIRPRMVAGEQGYLTPTPCGEVFDGPTTQTCRSLDRCQVAVLAGETRANQALADRLQAFVRGGGTLVINVRQLGQ